MQIVQKATLVLIFCLFWAGCGDDATVNSPMNAEEMENMSSTREGNFSALNGKTTSGRATLREVTPGTLRLDFSSDFSLSNGPGLFVMLSNSEFPSDDAVTIGGFISPTGPQMYTIPEGVTLDSFTHVLVHCVPYDVTFAAAELK